MCGYEDEIPKKGVVVLLGVGDDSTQDGMRAEFKDDNIRYGFVKVVCTYVHLMYCTSAVACAVNREIFVVKIFSYGLLAYEN